jgi:hypothetical protein
LKIIPKRIVWNNEKRMIKRIMKYVLLGVANNSNVNRAWKGEYPFLIKVIITLTEKAINRLNMGAEKHPKNPIC